MAYFLLIDAAAVCQYGVHEDHLHEKIHYNLVVIE